MAPTPDRTSARMSRRKLMKHYVEKRRRTRVNGLLESMKTMVLQATARDVTQYEKMEKADILEMTLEFLEAEAVNLNTLEHGRNLAYTAGTHQGTTWPPAGYPQSMMTSHLSPELHARISGQMRPGVSPRTPYGPQSVYSSDTSPDTSPEFPRSMTASSLISPVTSSISPSASRRGSLPAPGFVPDHFRTLHVDVSSRTAYRSHAPYRASATEQSTPHPQWR